MLPRNEVGVVSLSMSLMRPQFVSSCDEDLLKRDSSRSTPTNSIINVIPFKFRLVANCTQIACVFFLKFWRNCCEREYADHLICDFHTYFSVNMTTNTSHQITRKVSDNVRRRMKQSTVVAIIRSLQNVCLNSGIIVRVHVLLSTRWMVQDSNEKEEMRTMFFLLSISYSLPIYFATQFLFE